MRCIIAVVEGVEKSLLLNEVKLGNLPWWKQAIEQGSFFPLDCGPVPYEPSNLATAFSGVGPGYHGCYSYWDIHTRKGQPRVLTSYDVKAPRVWEWPELQGLKFAVVNVQLTHPPQPLDGFLISYPMQQTLHATYPKELQIQLARKGIRYAHDVTAFYTGEPLDEFAKEINRVARFQFDAICELAKRSDVLIANLTIADRLSHFLWSEIEDDNTDRIPHIIESYRFLDRSLKELEALIDDNGAMIIFSEIGFGTITEFVSVDNFLQDIGLQILDDNGMVDSSKSLAKEAVQGSHGINILSENGESGYYQVLEEVRAALLELRFSDGKPVVSSALPREEVYHGPCANLAPDIIISPGDLARPPMGDPYWAQHVHRHFQTGWHRDTGFCLITGKNSNQSKIESAQLEAIAPTIASILDRNIPENCLIPSLL